MEPPKDLRDRFADATWDMVWSHVPELQTWRITRPRENDCYLKLVAHTWSEVTVADEAARLRWLAGRLPVPRVLETGTYADFDWILTAGLPGTNAIDRSVVEEPRRLARALGHGLRKFHAAPNDACPFDVSNHRVLTWARTKLSAEELAELVALTPASEDLVLTHGDACLPNFLIEDFEVTGYVDLGAMGVADRWRDIAVCLWSLGRNLGQGWGSEFLEAYGVERDEQKLAFYLALYSKL